jgi:hypothetical protein
MEFTEADRTRLAQLKREQPMTGKRRRELLALISDADALHGDEELAEALGAMDHYVSECVEGGRRYVVETQRLHKLNLRLADRIDEFWRERHSLRSQLRRAQLQRPTTTRMSKLTTRSYSHVGR